MCQRAVTSTLHTFAGFILLLGALLAVSSEIVGLDGGGGSASSTSLVLCASGFLAIVCLDLQTRCLEENGEREDNHEELNFCV